MKPFDNLQEGAAEAIGHQEDAEQRQGEHLLGLTTCPCFINHLFINLGLRNTNLILREKHRDRDRSRERHRHKDKDHDRHKRHDRYESR